MSRSSIFVLLTACFMAGPAACGIDDGFAIDLTVHVDGTVRDEALAGVRTLGFDTPSIKGQTSVSGLHRTERVRLRPPAGATGILDLSMRALSDVGETVAIAAKSIALKPGATVLDQISLHAPDAPEMRADMTTPADMTMPDQQSPDAAADMAMAGTSCSTPASLDRVCIQGTVRNFIGGVAIPKIPVAVYEGLTFAQGGAPLASGTTDDKGFFILDNVQVSSIGVAVLAVPAPIGSSADYVTGATVASNLVGGNAYKIDGFAITPQQLSNWATTAGLASNAYANGAVVLCYYSELTRAASGDFTFYETTPVSGVTFAAGTGTPTAVGNAKYFGASLNDIQPSATATTVTGCGIANASGISHYSGIGPASMNWETHTAAAATNAVVFDRIHRL